MKVLKCSVWVLGIFILTTGVASASLELHYPLDGSAEDATGNGHDGTPVGGISWSDQGIKDGCLSVLSGHIQVGDRYDDGVMTYGANQDFTWALWFKPSGLNNDDEMLLSRRRYHGDDDQVSMHISYFSDGRVRMLFGADRDPATWGWSTSKCNDGEWHHVAIVRNTLFRKMLMYIDGNLEDKQDNYRSDYSAASSCRIGQEGETYGGDRQYHGLIDDVRVYSHALSQAEISQLYSSYFGSINGKVTDTDGNPIRWALVLARKEPIKESTLTDFRGLYELMNLEPGTYFVVAIKKGYAFIKRAEVVAGEATIVDFELPTKSGEDDEDEIPDLTNFPNPFNPDTWIPYLVTDDADVTIRIHDAVGKHIRTLDLGRKPAGLYMSKDRAAYWDGRNEAGEEVASGIYFYTIQSGEFTATRKMTVRR